LKTKLSHQEQEKLHAYASVSINSKTTVKKTQNKETHIVSLKREKKPKEHTRTTRALTYIYNNLKL